MSIWIACLVAVGLGQAEPDNAGEPIDDPREFLRQLEAAEPEGDAPEPTYALSGSISMFEERVEKNPNDVASRSVLGKLYLRNATENDVLTDYARAVKTLREVLEKRPDDPLAMLSLANALKAVHQFEEARELSHRAFEHTGSLEALAVRADAELGLGNYEKAFKTIEDLQTAAAPAAAAAIRSARAAELRGELDEAVTLAKAAYARLVGQGRPHDMLAWYAWRLAELHRVADDFDSAEATYRLALSHEVGYEPALIGLAELSRLRGKPEAAISQYEALVEDGAGPPVMASLGDLYQQVGREDAAEQMLDRAEGVMREEAKVAASVHYSEFADFLVSHDRHQDEALMLAAKDMEQRGDYHTRSVYAWCLFVNGQVDKAAKEIRPAVVLGVVDPEMRLRAGTILASSDPDLATAQFEIALRNRHLLSPVDIENAEARLGATRRRD